MWYNERKTKAMKSYMSPNQIKIRESTDKLQIIQKRQETVDYMSSVKARYDKFVKAYQSGQVDKYKVTEVKNWAS